MKKGIILHGGHGTRLRPLTFSRPKQLLPIANIPMSQFGLLSMKNAGITEIAIVVGGDNAFKVKEYYGSGTKLGVKITYIHQDKPLGISHAVGLCEEFIGNEKFVVFLGDNVLLKGITDYADNFDQSNDAAKILLCEVSNPKQFGIADVSNDGKIKKIMEKPKNPPTNLAVIGIYFFQPIIFQIIRKLKPSWRNELEITDALQMLLESNENISYNTITNYWKDTGTVEDILDANKTILKILNGEFQNEIEINGKIYNDEKVILENSSKIIGPTIIGKNCELSDVVIGPNVSIGNNCKITKCTIKDSIIMDNCQISGEINLSNSIISYNTKLNSKERTESSLIIGENEIVEL